MVRTMARLAYFVISLFLATLCLAEDALQEKANAYIDEFITIATNETGGFIDPLPLNDTGKSFEREIGMLTFKGEAKLYDGKIEGLSSLQREGDAVVIDLDDMLLISTTLTFKKIHAFYRGAILLNDKGPKFTMNARIGKSKVSMFLMAPSTGGKASLMSFNINKLSDIRVSVWGLGPMGWAASLISNLALNMLEKPVAKAASIKIFDYFSKEIEKVPFPAP